VTILYSAPQDGQMKGIGSDLLIVQREENAVGRLDVYAQAEQDQSRHDERSSDHRDERPYMGVRQPRVVSRVFVRSIHELCFCTFPDDLALT
jgi:hypothetical protein